MMQRILPTFAYNGSQTVLTQHFPQRVSKTLRQDLATASHLLEVKDGSVPPELALKTALRDIKVCKEVMDATREHLTAARTAKSVLEGDEYTSNPHPLVKAAQTLFAIAEETKRIDPNAALTDLRDTLEEMDEVVGALSKDAQICAANYAHCKTQLQRLTVAVLATKGTDIGFLAPEFDHDEITLKEALPEEIVEDLTQNFGWQWVKNAFPYGTVTLDEFEPDERNQEANFLAAACQRHIERQSRKKKQSHQKKTAERHLKKEVERHNSELAATNAMRGAAQ